MAFGYAMDDLFARHRPPGPHPECPERVVVAAEALRAAGLDRQGEALAIRPARDEELILAHTPALLEELTRLVPGQRGWLDADTYFGPETWDAALAAAGAGIDLARAVLAGRFQRGLALVRPPGHHAESSRAMGFCLLNNAALAAAAAREAGAARVAVLDWDVHHGNGTQDIFYADPTVLYLSVHQYPFYPGTGAAEEIGAGAGRGATVNVGLPSGSGDAELLASLDRVLLPALESFRPDLVICSAGFDMHEDDPLAGLRVTVDGYRAAAERVRRAADRVAGGRMIALLEGGYDLAALARSVVAVTEVLAGAPDRASDPAAAADRAAAGGGAAIAPGAQAAIDRTLAAHRDQSWAEAASGGGRGDGGGEARGLG